MYWANFLHIYQPPDQTSDIIDKVARESYRKIINGLIQNPQAKMTLNINAVLTEMLMKHGHADIVKNIRKLLEKGQIELTASAKFHPLLPKLPKEEIVRQIKINEETNRQYYGDAYNPQGFFPPEMGYSPEVGDIIANLGYKWIILDELASAEETLDPTKIYQSANGLHFFFRERGPSFKILSAQIETLPSLIREFGDRLSKNEYLLTAMDGETFGHHRLGLEQLLLEIYKSPELPTVCMSDLFDLFPERIRTKAKASTWALMPKDIAKKIPFARWDNPGNPIHQKQWVLTNFALKLVKKESEDKHKILDKALYSDQYWWASARPWWSLEMIERGAFALLAAIKSFDHASKKDKQKAWDLYIEIITTGFAWQRTGEVARISREEDEEIKERMEEGSAFISNQEYEQMIASLKKQMLAAAADQDYNRAEQFKKRIFELTADMENKPHSHAVEIMVNQ